MNIDFETRSKADLRKVGVYRYASDPSTDLLCVCWLADGEMHEWLPGDPTPALPAEIIEAWNAQFERLIWTHILGPRYGWPVPPLDQFSCTMVRACAQGLPGALEASARALGVIQQKDVAGNRLMKRLTKMDREKIKAAQLRQLIDYCAQDVRTEAAMSAALVQLNERERRYYLHDQVINERGVMVDRALILGARQVRDQIVVASNGVVHRATNGAVKSVLQTAAMTAYLRQYLPTLPGLDKHTLAAIDIEALPDDPAQVVEARRETAKASVAKYDAMQAYADEHNVMRGLLQFNGASTGRWAGRGPQLHNLPRPSTNPEPFLPAITAGDLARLDWYLPAMEILSCAVRSAIVARGGRRFIAADYNAIEARVLAWIAGQEDLLNVFRAGFDPYARLASHIYRCDLESVTKPQRLLGKIATLGLGYQMGPKRFRDTCAGWNVIIEPTFAEGVVQTYRETNIAICTLWKQLQKAALFAVSRQERCWTHGIGVQADEDWLTVSLPSGRLLWYFQPRVVEKEMDWGIVQGVEVGGLDGITRRWVRYQLYGGLLTENIVQATARDILADAMYRVENRGYPVVLTVHDEILTEPKIGFGSVREFEALLCDLPIWAQGCPIAAEGWEGQRYRK